MRVHMTSMIQIDKKIRVGEDEWRYLIGNGSQYVYLIPPGKSKPIVVPGSKLVTKTFCDLCGYDHGRPCTLTVTAADVKKYIRKHFAECR